MTIPSHLTHWSKIAAFRRLVALGGVFVLSYPWLSAATAESALTITSPEQVWMMATEQKSQAHPLHLEGRVSYYDPGFRLLWLERNDVGAYMLLGPNPPLMRTGQYVVLEGTITPNLGLSADTVTVRVVQENAGVTALETKGRINDLAAFSSRIVTAEGYVDSQLLVDADHVRLMMIVENRPVICWIKPDDPAHVPDWRGRLIRATGLYSSRFDPTQTSTSVELWVGKQEWLQVIGLLADKPAFSRLPTPINELYRLSPGTEVLVRGTIESHHAGTSMTVRDATGQVEIRSIQQERLPIGSAVEAVGRVALSSAQVVVDSALYRPANNSVKNGPEADRAIDGPLKTVAQIRALGAEEAARGLSVEISGMVTWSLPESDFFFLEDLTGGVRVYSDRAKFGVISYGKYFKLKGVTRAGRIAPAVELRDFTDLGSMSHPPAKPITLEEAMTGREDGEWVELRGFVRNIESQGNWRWIHVTTPAGDFTGHLQNPVNFVANPGSIIRIHGVCETNLDAEGRITGVTLRVPFLHDITIEEDAPADYYDLPRHAIGDLERISASQTMTRVRVTGTVEHAVPGQSLYLWDGNKALFLLSHETTALAPGDQIEAVGILGREGARTILRETVFRKTATGTAPEPLVLGEAQKLVPAADSRLVRLRGTLIDVFRRQNRMRLTLQQGNSIFEATLDHAAGATNLDFPLGAGLEVTGIYKLVFDDSHQSHGFQLELRSPGDVQIYAPAKLWTVQRALTVAGILGGCVLLGLAWIRGLRRQVHRQTAQIRDQMEQQARLEAEVQRAARLASLGGLAGGIAHDYNNLLTIIMGNLALMKFNPVVMATESGRVRDIEQGALRARDLSRQLLTFAEGGDPLRTEVDLSKTVHDAADRVVSGSNVRCAYKFAPDLQPAQADQEQIAQTVQNIVRNAVQAMPNGGTIQIELTNTEIQEGVYPLPPRPYLKLAISDKGEGIPRDVLPRIFDPFFTTRKTGGGLGLATVYSILKKHGGHIAAESKVGEGTTFTVWLPAAPVAKKTEPVAISEPARAEEITLPAGPARVLLMDDEDSIRRLGSMLLQRMGLEATAVPDGAAALREFERAKNTNRPFSLLILDLTIPGGMGGKDTIDAIRKTGAQVPAIVCSGYSRDPVMADFLNHGFQAVVPKPYEIGNLTEAVKRLLPGYRSA